jgi:phospholipid/cholesterol/gamma-HCH transport system substrate-binding protein
MGKTKREMQVGLIVIFATVVLVVGVLWLKQFRFSGGMATYIVDFPAVDGLQVRDRVLVRGIRMGMVNQFEIVSDFVRVTFQVEEMADMRVDALITLQTVGIVGEKVIEIDPGTGDQVAQGHVFKGQLAGSLTALSGAATGALADLRALASELQLMLSDIRAEDRLGTTVAAAESATTNLAGILAENRESLRFLIQDFRGTAATLRQALAGPDSALAVAVQGAARTFTRADTTLASLEETAGNLAVLLSRLEAGGGSLGKLLNDDRLYERADSTLASLNRLLREMKRNPKKYFKLSVF